MQSDGINPGDLTVEKLLPHRGRMLLVDRILALDEDQATTMSVARQEWPLFEGGAVNPLILVELVAQTAGIHNSLRRLNQRGESTQTRGWLVGVKKAVFHVNAIAPGEPVTATARNAFAFENLCEITGTASINGRLAAEVTLQLVEAANSGPLNADGEK